MFSDLRRLEYCYFFGKTGINWFFRTYNMNRSRTREYRPGREVDFMSHGTDFWWNNKVISVEKLHELAADNRLREIYLRSTVLGQEIGSKEKEREFSQWELHYKNGEEVHVYV